MKNTIIPAGYRLSVTSWENDGDNYRTEIISGLSDEQVRLRIALLKLFERKGAFGNEYSMDTEKNDALPEAYEKIISDHTNKTDDLTLEDIDDIVNQMGVANCSDFATRLCESFTVEYLEKPVIFKDVTANFI